MAVNPAIELKDVSLSFGSNQILTGIDMSVDPGEFICVIGASGSGKTTLLRMIAGLLTPTTGKVFSNGTPVLKPSRHVAVVFQDYGRALLPWRRAYANVSLPLEASGMPAKDRPARIRELLAKVGLANHEDKFPGQLSGGMQQRLQIARALAQEPDTLLMDEPFGALDAMTRQTLQDEVLRLVSERKTTVFFVTHDIEEALYLGDRVVALDSNPGRVAYDIKVPLPRPRDQLTTREHPEFLRLRREMFEIMNKIHA
ncbi:MAG TPA: ABC transporter ATP-binding protein [Xanthobacteraceae bacterium]|nr:ABC transporter ATP-binding protein [Xanthobacteraceae bacterium]